MNGASKWRLSPFSSLHGFPLHPCHQDLPGERSTLRAVQARPNFSPPAPNQPFFPSLQRAGPLRVDTSHLPFPSLSDYKQQPGPAAGKAAVQGLEGIRWGFLLSLRGLGMWGQAVWLDWPVGSRTRSPFWWAAGQLGGC